MEKQIPCCLQPQRERILVIVARSKQVAEASQLKETTRDQSNDVAFCCCSREIASLGGIESTGAPDQKGVRTGLESVRSSDGVNFESKEVSGFAIEVNKHVVFMEANVKRVVLLL
eukprot:11253509-Ditylum_brightwellii.AAC.1